jgi:hypothetical protein
MAVGQLTNVEGFMGGDDRPATCRSEPDGTVVAWIEAHDLGSIDGLTLQASFAIPEAGIATFRGEVLVDGGDLPESAGMPAWTGRMTIVELGPDRRFGEVAFDALELVTDPPPGLQPDGDPWPPTLAGSIRWSCGNWNLPGG